MPYDDSAPQPESASSVSPDRPWFTRRSTLAVAIAAIAPLCLAGWVLVEVTTGAGADDGRPPAAAQPPAAPPSSQPRPQGSASASASASPSASASASASPGQSTAAAPAKGPLAGRTVVIDPGHNAGNFKHTSEIDKQVDIGTGRKECDTTGTTTNAGYLEADFTLDVSKRLGAILEAKGIKVVFTHQAPDRPFGPCIDERARIGNAANADAVVSVHADGVAEGNRGFHVILPAKVKGGAADTANIVGPSRELGERIAGNFTRTTGSAPSNYVGGGTGLVVRDDLGGLNLSTRPKVFIECGNMRDAKDAALLNSPEWREKAAQGIANGIVGFLGG
ncbi:N-acetylmuramoyl-L-alanine amidase [Streptomyces sp. NBC_00536]|uniref:N-acetylmuramoyl-L-alanine amidase n=1 Tax=Streptomyces sp. NBC_00536 TaxID=2975769 RepID=UPI002E8214F6|nr:N-acetylmuramoyl-L-alanine amidase [Streptomyces sp. NBC_00536]WUC78785.1 N-acetylmuramoyl-L-alanine amidase [Streptomyces sp. NBC_00536]